MQNTKQTRTEAREEAQRQYPAISPAQPVQIGSLGYLVSPLNPREKIILAMHLVFEMSLAELARQLVRCPRRYHWGRPVRGRAHHNAISKAAVCKILQEARQKVFWHEKFTPKCGRKKQEG